MKTKPLIYITLLYGLTEFILLMIAGWSKLDNVVFALSSMVWTVMFGLNALAIPVFIVIGIIMFGWELLKYKKLAWNNFFPVIILIVFLLANMYPGSAIYVRLQDKYFTKNVSQYEKMIINYPEIKQALLNRQYTNSIHQELPNGLLDVFRNGDDITYNFFPTSFPSRGIHKEVHKDEVQFILFGTTGTLPNMRGGFVYLPKDNPNDINLSSHLEKIQPHWYRWFGDGWLTVSK